MTRYSIVIAPKAEKQIKPLPSNIKSRISDIILDVLAKNPFLGKALKAGLSGLYSCRIGDYRIIYKIAKHEYAIHILKVMHRREVYR